jgi:hypothetical protein
MAAAVPESVRPVEGGRIGESTKSKFQVLLGCLIAMPLGGVLAWAWWTELGFGGVRPNAMAGGLGVLVFVIGVVMIPLGIRNLFKHRDLILGADRLQIVGDGEKVQLQVPYKNISGAGLVKDQFGRFIGVKFANPRDPDTLNAGGSQDAGGWDCRLIGDSWSLPLEDVFERLKVKRRALERAAGTGAPAETVHPPGLSTGNSTPQSGATA